MTSNISTAAAVADVSSASLAPPRLYFSYYPRFGNRANQHFSSLSFFCYCYYCNCDYNYIQPPAVTAIIHDFGGCSVVSERECPNSRYYNLLQNPTARPGEGCLGSLSQGKRPWGFGVQSSAVVLGVVRHLSEPRRLETFRADSSSCGSES